MNRLAHETSPYLLQHKDNPVDWYPWGEEAFQAAQAQDKPILLSVGYSACHWCHVMAHESFEHGPTAELMNAHFINVKVDREERPDVDDVYMQAVLTMTRGHGGWPMTVFLTPQGKPFYGGTYYPREPRYGMPSFRQVLSAVADAFRNRRAELEQQADDLTRVLDRSTLNIPAHDEALNEGLLRRAAKGMMANIDPINGGFGTQPKFPNPMNLEYLLRYARHEVDDDALEAVLLSLRKMAQGGIYDQIGGGFHRYSVDAVWLVPHFEKMLYDNAQLSRLYLHAWQMTGDSFFRRIAEEVYDYVLREMTAPEGGFYSATDADSEGEEGKFFVWTMDEVRQALASMNEELPNAADIAIEAWGMTRGGNFEGKNILHRPNDDAITARRLGLSEDELRDALGRIADRLYAARTQRVPPGLDDKILAGWNGLMLASLAEAARVLDRSDYLSAAERCGEFLLSAMLRPNGRLWRTYKDGQARINAFLEDYAALIDAFLELYQSTFIDKWYKVAVELAEAVLKHFVAEDGGFYDTSDDHETLIVRPRSLQDNAVPSGSNIIARQLLRLYAYTGDERYATAARSVFRPITSALQQYPQAFGEALNALDVAIRGCDEIALIGNPTAPAMRELLTTIRRPYRPNQVVALSRQDADEQAFIPLLRQRRALDGSPTVYVCRAFVCQRPVTTPSALEEMLD
ncbi:MAG: thioredoxin domain-containing protein [Anaerolineae bacterium]|nr:thioredoxin domain-containing protein [Anaerolineae bacterium]MDW8171150.1 thioredoxin domain-containing protein [Anaerolineae bacterium]